MSTSNNYSHPLLWTLVIAGFTAIVIFFFSFWYRQGAKVGVDHQRPSAESGADVPDHATLIATVNDDVLALGEEAYGTCIACHGPDGMAAVNGARRFPVEEFKNGIDPYAQYQTLTRGYNLMPAQNMLSPEEKYAVIHYVRERFLREDNPDEYFEVTDDYLASGSWPQPGSGDGEVAQAYGANAEKPLTIPVMAISAQKVQQARHDALQQWRSLVAAADMSAEQQRQLNPSQLAPYAANQLLNAVQSEKPEAFVEAAGEFLQLSLLPQSELRELRQALIAQLGSAQPAVSVD